MMTLPVGTIRLGDGTQARAGLDERTVAEYAEAFANGTTFPPVTVFSDGESFWLADGFHRVEAARRAGLADIDADVRAGTLRDAVLYACGANGTHGLRRTNADKRRAVETLLADAEWVKWSDRKIAKQCGVAPTFVGTLRSSLSTVDSEPSPIRTYTTKHGTTATMDTANIGHATGDAPVEPTAESTYVDVVRHLVKTDGATADPRLRHILTILEEMQETWPALRFTRTGVDPNSWPSDLKTMVAVYRLAECFPVPVDTLSHVRTPKRQRVAA